MQKAAQLKFIIYNMKPRKFMQLPWGERLFVSYLLRLMQQVHLRNEMHICRPFLLELGSLLFIVCCVDVLNCGTLLLTHSAQTMVLIKKGSSQAVNRIGDHFIVTTPEREREGPPYYPPRHNNQIEP